jgi:hypothetical protein
MNYFEQPPEPEWGDWSPPEWYEAPRDELGVEIVVDQLVARSETALITVRSLIVFSNGFEVRLLAEWTKDAAAFEDDIVHPHSEQFLRVAVEYADGSRATNMDYALESADDKDDEDDEDDEDDDTPPDAPSMGSGHPQVFFNRGTHTDLSYWIWSLPPAGDVTVVCEWPAPHIPVSRMALDGDRIREASTRSQKLW